VTRKSWKIGNEIHEFYSRLNRARATLSTTCRDMNPD
jgi:hypothetical protein